MGLHSADQLLSGRSFSFEPSKASIAVQSTKSTASGPYAISNWTLKVIPVRWNPRTVAGFTWHYPAIKEMAPAPEIEEAGLRVCRGAALELLP